jgi:hypothetical protein
MCHDMSLFKEQRRLSSAEVRLFVGYVFVTFGIMAAAGLGDECLLSSRLIDTQLHRQTRMSRASLHYTMSLHTGMVAALSVNWRGGRANS